jgi:hypothetical protein
MKANLLRAVRSALARTRPLSEHPDANLLAAFAEKTLPARERAEVAGHLADCAECRKCVALAFGAEVPEPAAMARAREMRRRVLWSYAFSTAAICIVVSSAVWQYRARRLTPLEPLPGPPAISAPQPLPATAKPQPAAGAVPGRRFAPPLAASIAAPEKPAAPPPPPVLPPQQTADALSPVRQQIPAPQYNQQAEAMRPGAQYLVQEQAPFAPPALARSASAHMKTSSFGAMARPAQVVWRISFGVVQRSHDGRTWETVPIGDQVSFRAVARFGSDVWVGGEAGALFHSVDSGGHWERVATNTTGAIVAITAGAGEVVVTTEDGSTWRLTDTPR